MGINETLDRYFSELNQSSILSLSINYTKFLSGININRALCLIRKLLTENRKGQLKNPIQILAEKEASNYFGPAHRDHVIHSLLCYILGGYIYESALRFYINENINYELSWKITALLHDIGYIANNEPNSHHGYKIIKNHLADIGFSMLPCYNIIKEDQSHGIISAIKIIVAIDTLYSMNNPTNKRTCNINGIEWGRDCFDREIVPACTAIFLHNLNENYFKDHKLEYENHRLAYLLILTDELQDWGRSDGDNKINVSTNYDICVKDNRNRSGGDISYPPSRSLVS